MWGAARGSPAEVWLAPCIQISEGGRELIMRRTEPMSDPVWAALRVPAFFDDVTPENWGLLDGRPVCHDYACTSALSRGLAVGELRQAATSVWLGRRHLAASVL